MKQSIDIKQAALVHEEKSILGEGPMWHSIHQILYWVDIEGRVVHAWEPHTGRHREWTVSKRVSAVAPAKDGKLIVALHGEIAELDPATGETFRLVDIEADEPDVRCNDGKCDPAGRFWVGTMHMKRKSAAGSLYCLDTETKLRKVLSGFTVPNGMGWSSNGQQMYLIDSADHTVRRYRFDRDGLDLTEETSILNFEEVPDGMCVDAEGMLWIGFFGGGRVGRYNPDTGEHLADVRVPAPHVTSCCFGGKDYDTLFITTARKDLSDQQLKAFPLSGALFSCDPGVRGVAADIFGSGSEL